MRGEAAATGRASSWGGELQARAFEGLSFFVPATHLVPPFDLSLARSPAEVDDAALMLVGEVAESQIQILQVHPYFPNVVERAADLL